ncbi:MAG: sortase [Dehalococcoidia bacterium]|nr:sortase [Dehalococcoidia bacterium]
MSRSKRVLRGLGTGLMGVGLLLFLTTGAYYAYSYYSLSQIEQGMDSGLTEDLAQTQPEGSQDEVLSLVNSLASTPRETTAAAPLANAVADETSQEEPTYYYSGIFPANRMIIPSIEVDSPIVEVGIVFEEGEWQWERPKHAVGHLQGSVNPGQTGNIVMAGHIDSPIRGEGQVFKRLPEIKIGDVVVMYTSVRAFAYQVVAKKVVLPSEISVLNPTPDETLTLITCVPDFIYSHRLIVTAKRVSAL